MNSTWDKGIITDDTGRCLLCPHLTENEFLELPFLKTKCYRYDHDGKTFRSVSGIAIDGHNFICVAEFVDGILGSGELLYYNKDMHVNTAENQKYQKSASLSIVNSIAIERIGSTSKKYIWGEICSFYDNRSYDCGIYVRYMPANLL